MTKLKWLGATALVLSSMAAIPAAQAAQDADQKQNVSHARRYSQAGTHANRAVRMSNNSRGQYQRQQMGYNSNANGYDDGYDGRGTGFGPADAAANIVGGAVDTADAIATAPFRNDGYARYDNNTNFGFNNGYDNTGYNDNGYNNNGYNSNAAYNNGYDNSDSGFGPADVAANVVGGAIDTAGAIATAPFGGTGTGYAGYNNNYNTGFNNTGFNNTGFSNTGFNNGYSGFNGGYNHVGYDNSYAARNGFVCQPGTLFKGEDGRRHMCQ